MNPPTNPHFSAKRAALSEARWPHGNSSPPVHVHQLRTWLVHPSMITKTRRGFALCVCPFQQEARVTQNERVEGRQSTHTTSYNKLASEVTHTCDTARGRHFSPPRVAYRYLYSLGSAQLVCRSWVGWRSRYAAKASG
jgi:hypothetical protein